MRKQFLYFAERASDSAIYLFLATRVAEDDELLQLASHAAHEPVPNLFFASVTYLLYKEPSHALARYYPSHGGEVSLTDECFSVFKAFCLEHRDEMIELMQTRYVQTNEVRRSALFYPAFAYIGKVLGGQPLALVDVGTSSGLNLSFDKYMYRYSDGTLAGDPNSRLELQCEVRGKSPFTGDSELPKLTERVGIDLHPIDLQDQNEVFWALSLLWPDQLERIERLKLAIAIARASPRRLVEGNALLKLPEVVRGFDEGLAVCVLHSFTLNQFTPEARAGFEKVLCEQSLERDVWRLSLEWIATEVPELTLDSYCKGSLRERKLLARCHHHGEWISWQV